MREPFNKSRPREMKVPLLSNPGKGCATFQRFNGDPLNTGEAWSEEGPLSFPATDESIADAYLPSTVSYCRWFWDVLEPERGKINFDMITGALETARARGQTLQVRLMPFGSYKQPQLPGWYREKFTVRKAQPEWASKSYLEPDYDSAEYYETWGRIIAEFGRKFDGHPDLESVDVAFIGPWGEGAGNPEHGMVDRFVDLYVKSHPKTPLLINSDGYQFPCGIVRGCGWRCDCYGDLRGRKEAASGEYLSWNHTYDFYPSAVARARAADTWKTRPVTFETCATPRAWKNKWFAGMEDLDFIIRQGLKFHASVFMPKSCPIPPEYMAPLARLCDSMGYRFVLRQALWEARARRGESWEAEFWIENTGTAPVYREYRLALRIGGTVLPLADEVRSWLPGDAIVSVKAGLPSGVNTGGMKLSAALVQPGGDKPVIRFANEGADADGWLPLGEVVIE